ncbi:MAG: metal-binding protein [Mogibacterium sp.]|nr:metal-binding protein [Mogibacterium sp.]
MKNSSRFYENRECEYYPCHKGLDEINCLFCYCPFYHLEDCPGTPAFRQKEDRKIKVCTGCTYPHHAENYDEVVQRLRRQR